MSYTSISLEKRGAICHVCLNRPQADNCIDLHMATELAELCHEVNHDKGINVVVLTGAGERSFCAGEDPKMLSEALAGNAAALDELRDFNRRYNAAAMVAGIECPVVAAINGNAFGAGLALALACDLRLCSDKASLGVPDVGRGYFLASGITQFLPRVVGRGKAMELVLSTEAIPADEARRIGLVHRTVPPGQLLDEANRVAEEIASKAPVALRYLKEAVHKGMDMTLEQGLRLECDLYMVLHTTHDRTEGVTAFREKRQPAFRAE